MDEQSQRSTQSPGGAADKAGEWKSAAAEVDDPEQVDTALGALLLSVACALLAFGLPMLLTWFATAPAPAVAPAEFSHGSSSPVSFSSEVSPVATESGSRAATR